jgi:hypothetical protein
MLDAPLREGSTDSIENWALGGKCLSLCSRIGSSKQGSKAGLFLTISTLCIGKERGEVKATFRQDGGEKDLAYLTEVVDWRRAPHHTIDRSEANISGTLFIMSAYLNLLTLHSLGHR